MTNFKLFCLSTGPVSGCLTRLFLLAIASPGSNILAVMGTSMSVERKAGIALAIGVAMGSLS